VNAAEHRLLVHDGTFAVLSPSGDAGATDGGVPGARSEGAVAEGLFVRTRGI
jgi:hypothetical protein